MTNTNGDFYMDPSSKGNFNIIKNLKNSCGLVGFNEYFFSGKEPLFYFFYLEAELYSREKSPVCRIKYVYRSTVCVFSSNRYLTSPNFLSWQ